MDMDILFWINWLVTKKLWEGVVIIKLFNKPETKSPVASSSSADIHVMQFK